MVPADDAVVQRHIPLVHAALEPCNGSANGAPPLDEITISAYASMRTIDLADIHLIGVALCLGYLLFQIGAQAVTILRLWRKHTVYRAADGYNIPRNASLVLLDDDTAPYSFFNQIVVGTRGLSDDELRCILAHESLHVSRYHTADIICARLLCCGAWFNPFVWLMLRELRAVQEFQADAAAIGSCCAPCRSSRPTLPPSGAAAARDICTCSTGRLPEPDMAISPIISLVLTSKNVSL